MLQTILAMAALGGAISVAPAHAQADTPPAESTTAAPSPIVPPVKRVAPRAPENKAKLSSTDAPPKKAKPKPSP